MKKNIFNTVNKVTKDLKLKHSEVRVFLCLVSYNTFNKIFPSLKTISKDTGIKSIPDISKGLNRLKELGYIEIIRRKHQSNIYKINNSETEMKTKKEKSVLTTAEVKQPEKFMNDAIIQVTVEQVAAASGRSKAESSDYQFVYKLLKFKKDDVYKKDCMNIVRNCLMLLYLIKIHSEKFKSGDPYPYFLTVYPTSSYKIIHEKIFHSGFSKSVSIKTGLHNSYN